MGYGSTRFLTPLDSNLMCGICSGVLETPALTPCGHTFCEGCINKWLDTPRVASCPECRAAMDKGSTRPIRSLRNLIDAMEVTCPNKGRGCGDTVKIETQARHLETCSYEPVTCVGCEEEIARVQLHAHQMDCSALIALLNDELEDADSHDGATHPGPHGDAGLCGTGDGTTTTGPLSPPGYFQAASLPPPSATSTQLIRLLHRVNSLEKQVARLLDDLQEAHFKNSLLYLQNKKLKEEEAQRHEKLARRVAESESLSSSYDVTITNQHDIARLSLHIGKHLMDKPSYIDSDKVFSSVRKCYEMHFYHTNTNSRVEHDVHMLLATAFASSWFNSAQRITLGCWLQCVHRCQGCRQVLHLQNQS